MDRLRDGQLDMLARQANLCEIDQNELKMALLELQAIRPVFAAAMARHRALFFGSLQSYNRANDTLMSECETYYKAHGG